MNHAIVADGDRYLEENKASKGIESVAGIVSLNMVARGVLLREN